MSRIGRKPIQIPSGVTVEIKDQTVAVKGPKGELTLELHPNTSVVQELVKEKDVLLVKVKDENSDKAIWGTMRALLANIVTGVTEGFKKELELNGVGFKMNIQGSTLVMSLGFSHDVRYEIPKDVEASIEGKILTLTSISAHSVGAAAAEIRAFKKPEPYKGKGLRYTDEVVRRKVGKAAKTE